MYLPQCLNNHHSISIVGQKRQKLLGNRVDKSQRLIRRSQRLLLPSLTRVEDTTVFPWENPYSAAQAQRERMKSVTCSEVS